MAYNLNYPDYSQGFGGYGSYNPPVNPVQPTVNPAIPQPNAMQNFLSYASPAASIAGIGLSAYGAYQQQKAIEEQNELAKQIFEDERQKGLRSQRVAEEERGLGHNLTYGNYARGEEDRALGNFGSYAQRIGL